MVVLLAEYASGAANDAEPRALIFNNCRRLTMTTEPQSSRKVGSIPVEISYRSHAHTGHYRDGSNLMMSGPLLVHGYIEDVSHGDVARPLDDPLSIQNRPFEQLKLCGKAPETLTDQNWPLVDIQESRSVFIHTLGVLSEHWNHKLRDSRMHSNFYSYAVPLHHP